MKNILAIFSAALIFWVVDLALILLSMQFESSYEFRELVDIFSVFFAGFAAGALGTILAKNKNYLVLAGILLLISLPVMLIIILVPDGRPESVTSFVLMCLIGAYACLRGFQHGWRATSN